MVQPRNYKAKVCLVGEAAVGKTSLIRRFVESQYSDSYLMTIGVKVSKKRLEVTLPNDETPYVLELSIWDVMGQPQFRELLQDAYFTGVAGIIAVADLTRTSTIQALYEWIDRVDKVTSQAPVVVAGNKADLAKNIDAAALASLAKSVHGIAFRTSAKTGENVEQAFQTLGTRIIEKAAKARAEKAPTPS